jgi:hypothetical protein
VPRCANLGFAALALNPLGGVGPEMQAWGVGPKNAGSTIESALLEQTLGPRFPPRHDTTRQFAACDGFASHPSFAVLREPVDRTLSVYSYTLDDGGDGHTLRYHPWVGQATDFDDFVARLASRTLDEVLQDREGNGCNDFYMPQRDYVVGPDGALMVTYLLCVERLEEDWAALQHTLPTLSAHPLPKEPLRTSSHSLTAANVSASTRALIYSKALFADDLALWTSVCNASRITALQ